MARGFQRDGRHLEAVLDEQERSLVSDLMEQVLELVRPETEGTETGHDEFTAIVAGLGPGFGDGGPGSPMPTVPDTAEGLGGRGFGLEGRRDPALDRLFPAGHREDEQAAAEYRRLTEGGLRARKTANLRMSMAALAEADSGVLRLDEEQAVAMMVALTDVRLVVGERLGIRTDEDAERVHELVEVLPVTNPAAYALAVYDFLTWLQEGLASALLPE